MHGVVRRWLAGAVITTVLSAAACSDSHGPDTTPPSAVTDLTLVRAGETSATLTWTAPGDDGDKGQAASYDLRYSLGALPAGWDSATVVAGLPVPRPAGQADTAVVTGLTADRLYAFALRAMDYADNASDFSNVITAETNDHEPPSQVTDLHTTTLEPHAVTLGFTAPGDDGTTGTAAAYELRYGPNPITETTWNAATVFPGTPTPHAAGTQETVRVTGLVPETTVHLALRAKDDAGQEGPVSNDVTVTLPVDTVPPSAIADLAVSATGVFTATLTWTAPGNDGKEGRASSYAIRYAEAAITAGTWDAATPIAASLTPKEAGSHEAVTLDGLPGDRTLWFCVRALDERSNEGAVSNGAKGYVRREPKTWVVRVDGSGDAPTVQAGIDSASHGDAVLVHPGTYYEHVDFVGKNIRLHSAEGPEVTILDGSHEPGSVVTFRSGETREATLEGFTVTGGTGTPIEGTTARAGAGIRCKGGSPTIRDNVIRSNSAGAVRGWGGGLSVDGADDVSLASPLVSANVFEQNTAAENGGAIAVNDADVDIIDNILLGNEARYDGGAIWIFMGLPGTARIRNNEFVENIAGDHGGGIEAAQSDPLSPPLLIEGNLFVRNQAHGDDLPTDSGTGGGISMRGWAGTIANNTFAGNIGTGGAPCTGAAILVTTGDMEVVIEHNIFAASQGCAVVCRFGAAGTTLQGNIFWANAPSDIGNPQGCFGTGIGTNFVVDPLFCDPTHDDYRVRSDSPAITGGNAIGAFLTPGCTP